MTRALISVSDKKGIVDFAKALRALNIDIISTGGTKKYLEENDIPCIAIDQVTNFPEMLDGRVKTLHPAIHGGLLARRDLDSHMSAIMEHQIEPIDVVIVNLYPFKETISKESVTYEEAIENIDIGGPSMLRSAAKNHASVTVLVDPKDYSAVLEELKVSGTTGIETRKKLAAKVFRHTAAYDALIAEYLTKEVHEENPETLTLSFGLKEVLRYGENSQQKAAFYTSPIPPAYSLANAQQLHGKELSYNNIKDADAALRLIREFTGPTAVALKHMNPCGVGQAETIEEAFDRCYQADPVSIFGGIVAINRPVTKDLAQALSDIFLEIVLAPSFEDQALNILKKKKNIRLLTLDFSIDNSKEPEFVSVLGGVLVQDQDWNLTEHKVEWQLMTDRASTKDELDAFDFAWKVVKHVKSNAIVISNEKQTLGIGAGQMNRVGAAKIALEQAKASGADLSKAVLASDAFFPMNDTVALAAEYGIKAIIQPGGSIRDQESIDMANKHNMTMIKTSVRHFRH
ncbi:bifunctional phosphoribosylaminoimidazolecarboxamide formyltransferase/IMP cyclohydrolase [Granulicatella seriolae]|uniref:Bifunctional purine biosynthesis protein PurH n=1 Tax=Granulicatella seriolae TaxID=2967226 RepID=A0ABT1WNK3_9LACT|nr:bifunctional phosphoribosylaminoimidazolecarboxamide formyltransferase/IMP cyclohydrolase [Granulicatella seriolae]